MKVDIISKLKASLRGIVVLPEDPDYDLVRKIYNGLPGVDR